MPQGLVIREADEVELGRIVQLLRVGAIPGGRPGADDPGDLGPYRAALRDITGSDGAFLAGEMGSVVIGVCQLIVFRHLAGGGLCGEIESVHVHPDHQGSGVGAALINAAIVRARDLGCYRVPLTSNMARPDAHRSYERLGFEPSHVGFKLVFE